MEGTRRTVRRAVCAQLGGRAASNGSEAASSLEADHLPPSMAASAAARRTPATRIEAARRILDSYVDDEAISSLSTTDFINQLKDGRYLLLSARAIATSRGAKLSMDLVNPGGMGANHRNLEL